MEEYGDWTILCGVGGDAGDSRYTNLDILYVQAPLPPLLRCVRAYGNSGDARQHSFRGPVGRVRFDFGETAFVLTEPLAEYGGRGLQTVAHAWDA